MPGSQQVGRRIAQSLLLVVEDLERKPSVQLRVVDAAAFELTVLIVLDQVVVGVSGEGERVQSERIHRRQLQEPQPGINGLQMGQVEGDQVVAQEEVSAVGQAVQSCQCSVQASASSADSQGLTSIGAYFSDSVDTVVPTANLEVQ